MKRIKLTQNAYYVGGEYRLHTEGGDLSKTVLNGYYTASAVDEEGNEYSIYWSIANREAFDAGDEDCCNWENPEEVYSWEDKKPINAEIIE